MRSVGDVFARDADRRECTRPFSSRKKSHITVKGGRVCSRRTTNQCLHKREEVRAFGLPLGAPSFAACPAGEVTFEEFAKLLAPGLGRHEDASKFDCKGRHGLKTHKWEMARPCDWCEGIIPPQTHILVCITCCVDACHNCTADHLGQTATRITCKDRHGLVQRKIAGVNKCSACQGHIPEMATMFSCRLACSVDSR